MKRMGVVAVAITCMSVEVAAQDRCEGAPIGTPLVRPQNALPDHARLSGMVGATGFIGNFGVGAGLVAEAETQVVPLLYVRGGVRLGYGTEGTAFLGDLRVGLNLHRHGYEFVAAGSDTTYGNSRLNTRTTTLTWDSHCVLRRRDYRLFGTLKAGSFAQNPDLFMVGGGFEYSSTTASAAWTSGLRWHAAVLYEPSTGAWGPQAHLAAIINNRYDLGITGAVVWTRGDDPTVSLGYFTVDLGYHFEL
jgi:hypothetical protein